MRKKRILKACAILLVLISFSNSLFLKQEKDNVLVPTCDYPLTNLLQLQSEKAKNSLSQANNLDSLTKLLNLKLAPPTVSNSVSTTQSNVKANSNQESLSSAKSNISSNTVANAEGEKNSVAVSNVLGNSESNNSATSVDNSKAINVVDNKNNGVGESKGSDNSASIADVKTNLASDTNSLANYNSTALAGTQINTNADTKSTALENSIAQGNSIINDKILTDTTSANNSTSAGTTTVSTTANSVSGATNQSNSKNVAESSNAGNTTTTSSDNSNSLGTGVVNSQITSSAQATNGGNALGTATANSTVNTETLATNSSNSRGENTGGAIAVSNSQSNGTATPYISPYRPLQDETAAQPVNLTAASTPSVQGNGNDIKAQLNKECEEALPKGKGQPKLAQVTSISKPSEVVILSQPPIAYTSNAPEQVCTEAQPLLSAKQEETNKDKTTMTQEQEYECTDKDYDQDREGLRRKSRRKKHKKPKRKYNYDDKHYNDNHDEYLRPYYEDEDLISAPDQCEDERQLKQDFDDNIKELNFEKDPKFSDQQMEKDSIKEYDIRKGDKTVDQECTKRCKAENLGDFITSEVQDLLSEKILVKCKCKSNDINWFIFDTKNKTCISLESKEALPILQAAKLQVDEVKAEKPKAAPVEAEPVIKEEPLNIEDSENQNAEEEKVEDSNPPQSESDMEGKNERGEESGNVFTRGTSTISAEEIADKMNTIKGGKSIRQLHGDLGSCFNDFMDNKFSNLKNRFDVLKLKNRSYISNVNEKHKQRHADKAKESLGKINCRVPQVPKTPKLKLNKGRSIDTSSSLKNIKKGLRHIKPESIYFQSQGISGDDYDDEDFNDDIDFKERLNKRMEEQEKCDNDKFMNKFDKPHHSCDMDTLQQNNLKFAGADLIAKEVGRLKNKNTNYLGKIRSMFVAGGC